MFALTLLILATPVLPPESVLPGAPARLPDVLGSGVGTTIVWQDLRRTALEGDFQRQRDIGPELWLRRVSAGPSQPELRLNCPAALPLAAPPVILRTGNDETVFWLEADGGLSAQTVMDPSGCRSLVVPTGAKTNLVGAAWLSGYALAWRNHLNFAEGLVVLAVPGQPPLTYPASLLQVGPDVLSMASTGTDFRLFGVTPTGAIVDLVNSTPLQALPARGVVAVSGLGVRISYLRSTGDARFLAAMDAELGPALRPARVVEMPNPVGFAETDAGLVAYPALMPFTRPLGVAGEQLVAVRESVGARLVFVRGGHLETMTVDQMLSPGPTQLVSSVRVQRNPRLLWSPTWGAWAMSWEDWNGSAWVGRVNTDGGGVVIGDLTGALIETDAMELASSSKDAGITTTLEALPDGGLTFGG